MFELKDLSIKDVEVKDDTMEIESNENDCEDSGLLERQCQDQKSQSQNELR